MVTQTAALRSFSDLFSGHRRDLWSTTDATVTESNGIPYLIDEFWTSRHRQAHRIHEVSYRACFKPQLPAFFIERLTEPGDVVYDPFMGRGTTPIEAALQGRVPYGNDVNPLSRTFVEPRINPPDISRVVERLESIPWNQFISYERDDLLAFYHPKTLTQIEGLRKWLLLRRADGTFDHVDHWIEMVAVNRMSGHSPGFFSVYTLPPNQAVSVERQKKINEKRGQVPPQRNVRQLIIKKSAILLSHFIVRAPHSLFLTSQSHETFEIPSATVDLTVTSPPFLNIVNYETDNWLRCWFLGIDPATVKISTHKKIEDWQAFVRKTFVELARITKHGGYVAFEVGEVRNGTIRLDEYVIDAVCGLPFETYGVLINKQSFTKTSNCWGVSNNSGGTNTNRIVVLRRNND